MSTIEQNAYLRKWRKENPEKIRLSRKNYQNNNREKINNLQKEYRKNNPEKTRAQNLVKSRKIPLKSNCEKCGTSERLEHHHPDYTKPLITTTLCKHCHANINKGV